MKITNVIKTLAASFLLAVPMLASDPQHVVDANALIDALQAHPLAKNIYNGSSGDAVEKDKIGWSATDPYAVSVCGTFVTMLMKHSYLWSDGTYYTKMGSTSPNAAKYYDAITTRPQAFMQVTSPLAMTSGNVIAVKYPDSETSSGHVMIATTIGLRQLRNSSTQDFLANGAEPNIDGYFDVTVMDSSHDVHGPSDSRASKPGGVGRGGIIRLYVDANNNILGFTWSTLNVSKYRSAAAGYPIAVGSIIH